jgi:hypothetical protein
MLGIGRSDAGIQREWNRGCLHQTTTFYNTAIYFHHSCDMPPAVISSRDWCVPSLRKACAESRTGSGRLSLRSTVVTIGIAKQARRAPGRRMPLRSARPCRMRCKPSSARTPVVPSAVPVSPCPGLLSRAQPRRRLAACAWADPRPHRRARESQEHVTNRLLARARDVSAECRVDQVQLRVRRQPTRPIGARGDAGLRWAWRRRRRRGRSTRWHRCGSGRRCRAETRHQRLAQHGGQSCCCCCGSGCRCACRRCSGRRGWWAVLPRRRSRQDGRCRGRGRCCWD